MRYSILGFNQEELIKYDIDMTDVLLMDYIQKALSQPSMIKTTKDEQPYVWLQHSKILEDLPILNIKESMLKKRIAKLVELGLIVSITIANEYGRGSRSYYTITESFEALQMTECKKLSVVEQTTCKKLSVVERPSVKNYTSDNKLIDNNKLNKSISKDIDTKSETSSVIDKVKPKKLSLYDKCVNMINEFTDDTILQELLVASLMLFLENSRESSTPFYSNTFKGKLNNLRKLSDDDYDLRSIVQQTLDNGWNNFYEIKRNNKNKNKTGNFARDVEHLTGGLNRKADKRGDSNEAEKF